MGGRGASSGVTGGGRMTASQSEAVEWYVSGEGMWINQTLRGNGVISMSDLTPKERDLLNALDGATTQNITQKTLYRSVDAEAVFGKMSDMDYDNLRSALIYNANDKFANAAKAKYTSNIKGKTITEKGFMSTTTSKTEANEWGGFTGSSKPIVLQLNVKSKIKGRDLTKHSMGQSEVLLARNQKYKITNVLAKDRRIYVIADI